MSRTASTSVPGWWVELQAAVLRQLPRPSEIDQETAEVWIKKQDMLKRCLSTCLLQALEEPPGPFLLAALGFIRIPTTTGQFVAKEKFVINTKRNAPVKISFLGNNFTEWFLSGDGKTEGPITETTLRYHQLRQSSVDGPIIAELGGEAKAETTLSEMFFLMEKQGKGEDSVLLNNGWANIFYIKDGAGVLRSVRVHWRGGGWSVGALSVEDPFGWDAGRRVFSRGSLPQPSEPTNPMNSWPSVSGQLGL